MDNTFDAEVFAKLYRITTVQVMNGAVGLIGGMAKNADEFKLIMDQFIAGFGAYLTGLTEAEIAELYTLLAKQGE
ncbi:MAG: hypothetical protein PHI71_13325 [Acidiphilium sp.]|nr:hypothetical protein [Acidiphilium sp.]